MNIIMEHTLSETGMMFSCVYFTTLSASKQQDYMFEQIDFGCFYIVICNNTAV